MKNIIVTAGGTSEPIDSVRAITNSGTGRLGSLTAEAFARCGAKVFYICSETALKPSDGTIDIITVRSVNDLKNAVEKLLAEERIDAVIHSMAVSDYTVRAVSTVERVSEALEACGTIESALDDTDLRKSGEKLSSRLGSPLLLLEPTPKILPMFKSLAPDIKLVGFKLLSGVTTEKLFEVARKLMADNCCDSVLANDSDDISGDSHIGYLLGSDGSVIRLETKQEIAAAIVKYVMEDER